MSTSDDRPADEPSVAPRFGPPTTANPLWRMVAVTGAAFVLSCLLWITSGIGNPEAPVNQWLIDHGIVLVLVSGAGAIVSAVCAMALDSVQTTRMRATMEDESRISDAAGGETVS